MKLVEAIAGKTVYQTMSLRTTNKVFREFTALSEGNYLIWV